MGNWLIAETSDSISSIVARVLIDSSIKAGALLAIAIVTTWLLRRSASAIRDRIWTLAFCGAIVLPLISSIAPPWPISLAAMNLAIFTPPAPETTRMMSTVAGQPDAVATNRQRGKTSVDAEYLAEFPSDANDVQRAPSIDDARRSDHKDQSQTVRPQSAVSNFGDSSTTILVVWLAGLVVLTVPFVTAIVVTGKMLNHGRRITEPAVNQLLDQISTRLGLVRRVSVLQAGEETIPMTIGVFRFAVVLPSNWYAWSAERLRFVILHELAHVKRWDILFQSIARAACAVYWFNPLAWYALHRMRVDCEMACDDRVIATGEPASTYAGELIEMARFYRRSRFAGGIAMARSSKLEGRIVALLDPKRSHQPLSKVSGRLLLVFSAGLIFGVAALAMEKPAAIAVEPAQEKPVRSADRPAANTPAAEKPKADQPAVATVDPPADVSAESDEILMIGALRGGVTDVEAGRHFLGSGAGGICLLAQNEAVLKELGIDDETAKKIQWNNLDFRIKKDRVKLDLFRENQALIDRSDLTREGLAEKRKEILAQYDDGIKNLNEEIQQKLVPSLKELLTDEQLERLQQIALRAYGSQDWVADSELAGALELTKEQIEGIASINREFDQKKPAMVRARTFRVKHLDLDEDRNAKALELLSAAQREKLAKLQGKPFNLALLSLPALWRSTAPPMGRPDGGGIIRTREYSGLFALMEIQPVQKELGLRQDDITKVNVIKVNFATAWVEAGGRVVRGQGIGAIQRPVMPTSSLDRTDVAEQPNAERRQAIKKSLELWNATVARFFPQLKETLTAEQFSRLRQINWQAMGSAAFYDADVVQALAITNEQRDQIAAVTDEYFPKIKALRLQSIGRQRGNGEIAEKFSELTKEQDAKIHEVLTKAQLDQFAMMKGEPFQFPLVTSQPAQQLFEAGLHGHIFSIFRNEAVEKELELSQDAAAKLHAIKLQFTEDWVAAGGRVRPRNVTRGGGGLVTFQEVVMPQFGIIGEPGLSKEERDQRIAKMTQLWSDMVAKAQTQIKDVLTPEQYLRLQQIYLQATGTNAFGDADVIQTLGITKDQQDRIAAIRDEYRTKRVDLLRQSAGDAGSRGDLREITQKAKDLANEQDRQINATLTKDQLDQFATMKGKEFDVSPLLERDQIPGQGRGPGFGGRGGEGRPN